MRPRNEERLLQQLADDVARLTNKRDTLAKRLAEAEARAASAKSDREHYGDCPADDGDEPERQADTRDSL